MTRTTGSRFRGLSMTMVAVLVGGLMLWSGSVGQAATPPIASSSVSAPIRACPDAAAGSVTCLASFRSVSAARQVGAPANAAGLAASRAGVASHAVVPPTSGYGPAEIRSIYSLDVNKGAGQTVAIVDAYDNPNAEKDLATFRSAYHLPACTSSNGCFRKVNQRGGKTRPTPDAGWGVEIALDLQAVSSTCPKCKLLLVEADSSSLDDIGVAVNRAVALGARVVSNSYGAPEFTGVIATGRKYYSHPGVAMVAASGDYGFTTAAFPATLTNAIAVGGTKVVKNATGWKQTAWSGASSGCSAWIPKPSWQKDPHCLMRTISDISALADPDTGLAIYDTYGLDQFGFEPGWLVMGGTSLATPLVSGMVALAGNAGSLSTADWVSSQRNSDFGGSVPYTPKLCLVR